VVIKEAWFPTGGNAAATEANQNAFFQRLAAHSVIFVWGEAYDQPWKTGEQSPFGTLGPEWGLHGSDGSPKQLIQDLAPIYTSDYHRVDEVRPCTGVTQRSLCLLAVPRRWSTTAYRCWTTPSWSLGSR
jgi:hypothetical protein